MARTPISPVGPDAGDLDGQNGSIGNEQSGIAGNPVTADRGTGTIDPASLTADAGDDGFVRDGNGTVLTNRDGSPKRKRGRKPGGNNSGNAKQTGARNNRTVKDAVEGLSQTLIVLHMGIANLTKFSDFALDKQEADALAAATANVMDQFDFTPDPRFTAVAGLVSTASMIYGPRYFLYKQQQKTVTKKDSKSGTVTAFPGSGVVLNGDKSA